MDAKELKEQLELAVKMGKEMKAKNEELEQKAAALEEKNVEMCKKFEALSKQIEDAGGDEFKSIEEMAKTIVDLQNEISDVRSKQQKPSQYLPEQAKDAMKAIAGKAIGNFVAQKKRDGGVKADDLKTFMGIAGNAVIDEMKSLNISTPADGGLAIAEILATDVLDYARKSYPILQEVGFKSGMTRNYRQLINLGGVGVRRGSENTDGQTKLDADRKYQSTSTQTYTEVKSNVFKASAEPLISDEAMNAPDIDIYADLIMDLGIEVGEWLATEVTLGTGTLAGGDGSARGILGTRLDITNTTGESWKPTKGADKRNADVYPAYPTGVSGDLGADDKARVSWLLKFMRQLPPRYRSGAKLYMNENTLSYFELLRDANERPVFRVSYMEGEPRLNGKPVVLDDNMPDIGADAAFIMYGDLKLSYAINNGDVEQMIINPYIVRGATVVEYDKEMFEMMQRSDALLIGVATTNSGA